MYIFPRVVKTFAKKNKIIVIILCCAKDRRFLCHLYLSLDILETIYFAFLGKLHYTGTYILL